MIATDREVWALQRSEKLRAENQQLLEDLDKAMARMKAAVKAVVDAAPYARR